MKKLSSDYQSLKKIFFSFFIFLFISNALYSNEILFEIKGNDFTDREAILSLLDEIPKNIEDDYSNEIIKALNDSNLFSEVSVININEKYIITVKEYPSINRFYFKNNKRLKDEDLQLIASQINLSNFNQSSIKLYIEEIERAYKSFGYNNVNIEYYDKFNENNNTVDLYFDIKEGNITKISKIFINGNENILTQEILEVITSKTKTIRNIFANNNFKPNIVENDKFLILNYYKNNGFIDVEVQSKIEYLRENKVNIYFNINEGNVYSLSTVKFEDVNNILNPTTLKIINKEIEEFQNEQNIFSIEKVQVLKNKISKIIIESGIDFFEINSYEKIINNEIELNFKIMSISPKYANQINIIGNYRTFDYVIRRELEIVEGDAIYTAQIKNIRNKLVSLNLFESVKVKEENIDDDKVNLIIEIEEKQTGTFNAGVSVGTLDGFSIVTGLRERNFYGTGRSLDLLVNTSQDKNQFKLKTTDRLSYENNSDISYGIDYKQQDFSESSSYKLNALSLGIGIGYKLNNNLFHNVDLEYVLKDYVITNSSTVSNTISKSSGQNVSYLLRNNLRYSTLNPGFIPRKGIYFNYNNSIETPTSSTNGFVRNLITTKQYYSVNKNIFSIQSKLGNIFSLNNNDILTDDKFALGGRWLRGFDSYGAGPRNSRTSYVGGNNIVVGKLDYNYELTRNSDFPIYLNLFNDYGLIWDNKTKPTQNDNSLRSSAGFGIKYYSPVGPIGFSWGFPLMDEEYDINRMFLFSIGNID